mmetsp:Transcript_22052/g.29369  ORF Transcript_22052/g.29369 Transcript_22052/m.29369 type:complete len:89 (+) Transcript_22052:703-969(+)
MIDTFWIVLQLIFWHLREIPSVFTLKEIMLIMKRIVSRGWVTLVSRGSNMPRWSMCELCLLLLNGERGKEKEDGEFCEIRLARKRKEI